MSLGQIRVFRLNEYEAYAGRTWREAIRASCDDSGNIKRDVFDSMYAKELNLDSEKFADNGMTLREHIEKIFNGKDHAFCSHFYGD